MSGVEYRNLLFEISQKINWITERQRLLFVTKGLIAEGSETNIQDVLSLFNELEDRKNLGIDRLEVLKDLLKGTGKWNLLEKAEKLEIKRKEFNSLLAHISCALDESGHLERLVSVCKGRIAKDRESDIKDVRTLLTELEKENHLGIGRLDILKVLIAAGKPDLLKQVEEFESKRKQEEAAERKRNELEESKRRRNGKASLSTFCLLILISFFVSMMYRKGFLFVLGFRVTGEGVEYRLRSVAWVGEFDTIGEGWGSI